MWNYEFHCHNGSIRTAKQFSGRLYIRYRLYRRKTLNRQIQLLPPKISVAPSEKGDQFFLRSVERGSTGQDGTWIKKQPTSMEDGDTGARFDTVNINENEVADIRQEFGIVGYIREYHGISHPR